MVPAADRRKARFAEGDAVSFPYRRGRVAGTIVRMNPKRAIIRADGTDFTIPYESLTTTSEGAAARVERIEAVHDRATKLIARHGLKRWRFAFDHSTRRAGCCRYSTKTLSIAFDLAANGSEADIRDTILHEIAHALVGRKHHHDAVWKAKAVEIGGSAERTHRLQFAPPRWNVTCENRCWSHTAQQRNSKLICRKCGEKLIYSPARP